MGNCQHFQGGWSENKNLNLFLKVLFIISNGTGRPTLCLTSFQYYSILFHNLSNSIKKIHVKLSKFSLWSEKQNICF